MFVLFMSISQSIFVFLVVRVWFNISRPIFLVYIWGHYIRNFSFGSYGYSPFGSLLFLFLIRFFLRLV